MVFTGIYCRLGRMDKFLQILLWIYSNTDSPPASTFTQDTCTLLCLFCIGAATQCCVSQGCASNLPDLGLWSGLLPVVSSPLPSWVFNSSSCLFLSLLLAISSLQPQFWAMLCWFGMVPPRPAAGEQDQTPGCSAGAGGTEVSSLWANRAGTLPKSLWGLVQSKESCCQTSNCSSIFSLLPSQVTNGNSPLCRAPCLPVALGNQPTATSCSAWLSVWQSSASLLKTFFFFFKCFPYLGLTYGFALRAKMVFHRQLVKSLNTCSSKTQNPRRHQFPVERLLTHSCRALL